MKVENVAGTNVLAKGSLELSKEQMSKTIAEDDQNKDTIEKIRDESKGSTFDVKA